MDDDLRKRIGRFRINADLIWSWGNELLFKIMAKCIIIKAESNFFGPYIEYFAYSYEFELVEEGMTAPLYEWQIDEINDKIKAVRVPDISDAWAQLHEVKELIDNLSRDDSYETALARIRKIIYGDK